MLGLADQVGGDVHRVGGGVGEDRDLGRAGLGVDADHAAHQPFGGGDVDVARAGDDVDRLDADRRRRRRRPARWPARRRPRRPRRRRAARTRRGSSGAAARRTPSAAARTPRSTRRRRPGRARRSSRRWTGRPPARPGTYSPTRRTGIQRSVTVPPGTTSTSTLGRRCASCTMRARRIDSVSAARTAGSRSSSAAGKRLGGHPRLGDVDAVEAQGRLAHRRISARGDVLDDGRHGGLGGMHVDLRRAAARSAVPSMRCR